MLPAYIQIPKLFPVFSMSTDEIHVKEHWKMIIIGSWIGFLAIIFRIFYYLFMGDLPKTLGEDAVEIVSNAIVLAIFLYWIHFAIVEYNDIKARIEEKKQVEQQKTSAGPTD
jgi:uncharacterized membrane protein